MDTSQSLRRLALLKNHTKGGKKRAVPKPILSSADYLDIDGLLTSKERETRMKLRYMLKTEVEPVIDDYLHKTEFPFELVDSFKKVNINGMSNTELGAAGLSHLMAGVVTMELFRCDPSIATFFLVHNCIGMDCIFTLGSEE